MANLKNEFKKAEKDKARTELGKRLRQEIQNSRKTYKEIADGTGLTYSYISDLANGKYLSTTVTLYKLCKYLGCDLKGIINGLEYWIKPKTFIFEDDNTEFEIKENDLIAYYDCLELEIQTYEENYDIETAEDLPKKNVARGFKFTGIIAQDDSMDLLGIYKDDTVTIEEGSTEPKSDNIYAMTYKGKDIIRKIYVDGDNIILIPFSRNKAYKIEKTILIKRIWNTWVS